MFFCRQRKQVMEIETTESTGTRMTETLTERDTGTETMERREETEKRMRSEKSTERSKRSVD